MRHQDKLLSCASPGVVSPVYGAGLRNGGLGRTLGGQGHQRPACIRIRLLRRYGGISGLRDAVEDTSAETDETAYDEFICGLQRHVRADDAVIILESGREKLCYLVGSAEIITHSGYDQLDISKLARHYASVMLDNPEWQTRFRD